MSTQVPTIEIGEDTSHGGGTLPYGPFSIGQDLTQLLANGGNLYQQSGSTIIDMDAGVVSEATPFMIGVVIQGVTCTTAMVQANQNLLDELGAYARQDGYTITLEAQLDLSPAANWNYMWERHVALTNLPITAIENDHETAWTYADVREGYAQTAEHDVNIVKQLVQYFPNVQIGQWEAQWPPSDSAAWWSAYDQAAAAAGLLPVSYVVA